MPFELAHAALILQHGPVTLSQDHEVPVPRSICGECVVRAHPCEELFRAGVVVESRNNLLLLPHVAERVVVLLERVVVDVHLVQLLREHLNLFGEVFCLLVGALNGLLGFHEL